MALEIPATRPCEIVSPESRQMGEYPRKDWIDCSDENFDSLLIQMNDDRYVLGETSTFVDYEWSTPRESRIFLICHETETIKIDVQSISDFHPTRIYWTASAYGNLFPPATEQYLTIRANNVTTEVGAKEWFAFNPSIAVKAGWKLSEEGLFRWVDDAGEMMVESIWWKDGPIRRHPPRINVICSEGWLVVASEKAVQLLFSLLPGASQRIAVIRSFEDSDLRERTIKSAVEEKNWRPL